jgi:ATP-binding cassette, subfamily B, bacterial
MRDVPIARKALRALRMGRAVRLVWNASPAAFVASTGLWVALGLLPPLALIALKWLVDALATPGSRGAALWAVALLGGLALLSACCQSLSGFLGEAQGQRVADHVAEILHAKSLELDLEYYDDARYYDVLHRAQQEAPYRPYRVVSGLTRVAQGGLALAATAGLLLSLEWTLALVLFVSTLPGVVVKIRASRVLYAWRRSRTEDERRSWYYQSMLIDGAYAKEARLFGFGDTVRGWFRVLRARLRGEQEALLRRRAAGDLVAQALGVVPVFAALGYLAAGTLAGRHTLGDLVLYYTAVQRGSAFLQELLSGLASLYEDNLFLSAFEEFLALPSRVKDPEQPEPLPRPVREGLVVESVRFRYARSEERTLAGVSLAVHPGEVVALVGENGAGKTTLVKLLCRLYDPEEGRILLDGVPIDRLSLTKLRGLMTVAFQDPARFNLTVRENVTLGDTQAPADEARLARAAGLAGAQPVIERLPGGYEALLGHWLEGGHELSVGEWQRIALARTLWRDAWLVILDEPTSAMDAETEARFWEELRPALHGRAALLISHRFSTVRQADRIYVLAGGRVVEEGRHEDLVARGGRYAHLYGLQARLYE